MRSYVIHLRAIPQNIQNISAIEILLTVTGAIELNSLILLIESGDEAIAPSEHSDDEEATTTDILHDNEDRSPVIPVTQSPVMAK